MKRIKNLYNYYLNVKFTRFLNLIINKYNYKIKTYIVKDVKLKNNTISITAKRKYSIKSKTTDIELRVFDLYFNSISSELDIILIGDVNIDINKLSNYLKNKKLITIWYTLPKGEIDVYPGSWEIYVSNTKKLVKIIKII